MITRRKGVLIPFKITPLETLHTDHSSPFTFQNDSAKSFFLDFPSAVSSCSQNWDLIHAVSTVILHLDLGCNRYLNT